MAVGNVATCWCRGGWEKMESLAGELLPCDNTHFGVTLFISATRINDLSPDSPENKARISCPSFIWKAWIHDLESEAQRKRGRKWRGNSGGAVPSSRLLLQWTSKRHRESLGSCSTWLRKKPQVGCWEKAWGSLRDRGRSGWRRGIYLLCFFSFPASLWLKFTTESSLPASYEPWAHLWMATQKARSYAL